GKVGTGFTDAVLSDLNKRLKKLTRKTSPFVNAPRERGATWVEPELVGEIEFTEWTRDGVLRHPSFKGLRFDRAASEVVRAVPRDMAQTETDAPSERKAPKRKTGKQAERKSVASTRTKRTDK